MGRCCSKPGECSARDEEEGLQQEQADRFEDSVGYSVQFRNLDLGQNGMNIKQRVQPVVAWGPQLRAPYGGSVVMMERLGRFPAEYGNLTKGTYERDRAKSLGTPWNIAKLK